MKKILLFFLGAMLITGCGSDSGSATQQENATSFNKNEMLQHWANNFIGPAYEDFDIKSSQLENSVTQFISNPNETSLQSVRNSLDACMLSYQYIGFYRFGKAEDVNVNFQYRVNTFPVNTDKIKENAINANYNFTSLAEISGGNIAQGLPAIDYMVNSFGTDSDANLLAIYTSHPNAEKYKSYLKELAKEISRTSKLVKSDWLSQGKNNFLANTGNNATTSINVLSNAYIQYYEKNLRAGKFGYPTGILTPMFLPLSTNVNPNLIESRFSPKNSRKYALEGIKAMQQFFNGEGLNGKNGPSYRQYLEAKDNNGKNLAQNINLNFSKAIEETSLLNENFEVQLNQNPQKMKEVYHTLQKNVPLIKVDMAQALNITISYMDTDGD